MIHRVSNSRNIRMYLDEPQWIAGENSDKDALAGNLPIHNVREYLSKHPEICFVMYRDYKLHQSRDDLGKDYRHKESRKRKSRDLKGDCAENSEIPFHERETVEPTTEVASWAIDRFREHFGFNLNTSDGLKSKITDATNSTAIEAPYFDLYHTRKGNLNAFLETLETEVQHQFRVLLDYVDSQYADEYQLVDEMIGRGKILNSHVRYLFKPGDIVVQGHGDDVQGFLIQSWLRQGPESSKKGTETSSFNLHCQFWDFDGMFSRNTKTLKLECDIADTSEKNIDDLHIRPLKYAQKATTVRLEQRGQRIWKCRVRSMVSYGEVLSTASQSPHDGRYMIDMMMYREIHRESDNGGHRLQPSRSNFVDVDEIGPEKLKEDSPPDGDFVYLFPTKIRGYNLKTKKWLELQVDRMQQVVWNTRAFDSLVINSKTKRLIQALISNQIETDKSTDLISGKGNGLILLLHGGPGTGKTLTAESVAEIARKPLYPVTCGDIGTEPEAVENYLESVLHIGKTWGCVVLLDEADVFLEQRSLEDLRRNALVSVFLRVLEYYDGILVLTSNRVGTFDEAFKSRIQLAVHYKNLDLDQRKQIWRNFIGRLEELEEEGIDFADLKDNIKNLAANKLNGREIRNVITTARQYARWERQQPKQQNYMLDYKVMDSVLKTAGEFDEYIQDVHGGMSSDQLAAEDGWRVARTSTD